MKRNREFPSVTIMVILVALLTVLCNIPLIKAGGWLYPFTMNKVEMWSTVFHFYF